MSDPATDNFRLKTNVSAEVMGVVIAVLAVAGAAAVIGGGYNALTARRDDDGLFFLLLLVLPGIALLLLALGLWKSFFQPVLRISNSALHHRTAYRWRAWPFSEAQGFQYQRVWVQPRRSTNDYASTIPYWRDWLTILPVDPAAEPYRFLLPASDGNADLLASLEARSGLPLERLPSVDEDGKPK